MVEIFTLGDFDIKVDNVSILESMGNKPKLMKLFKYFLTFRGKKLLPEKIIEDIWEDENFVDPLNVLRTQISRVRKMIDIKQYNIDSFFEINYVNGYYLFKLGDNCTIDFTQIESYIDKSNILRDKNEIMEVCKEGIKLYKGEYLGELGNEEWILPSRSRLDRLYTKSLVQYLNLLKEQSLDNNIITLCEESIIYKPYEETIYIYLLESLINLGQNSHALTHYTHYTRKIYSEFRETPSNKMKNLYKEIRHREDGSPSIISLDTLDRELKYDDETQGATLCDNSYFKFLYNLELKKTERNKDNVFIGTITIDKTGYSQLSDKELKNSMNILLDTIYEKLRRGDVLTQWNGSQALLLLYNLEEHNIEKVIERVIEGFENLAKNKKVILNVKFKKV